MDWKLQQNLCKFGLRSAWTKPSRKNPTCLENASDELMANHNACVNFFERREFNDLNKSNEDNNLRAVKYSICVLDQYKNALRLQDSCNAGDVNYYPKQIDFLKKAYDTIKHAKAVNLNEIKAPIKPYNRWERYTHQYTLEDQSLVSKSLQNLEKFCQDYSDKAESDCDKAKAYNKCVKVIGNAAVFWSKIDNNIPAEFKPKELAEVCAGDQTEQNTENAD